MKIPKIPYFLKLIKRNEPIYFNKRDKNRMETSLGRGNAEYSLKLKIGRETNIPRPLRTQLYKNHGKELIFSRNTEFPFQVWNRILHSNAAFNEQRFSLTSSPPQKIRNNLDVRATLANEHEIHQRSSTKWKIVCESSLLSLSLSFKSRSRGINANDATSLPTPR